MNNKKRNICAHCIYGLKEYFSIGNRIFFDKVTDCGVSATQQASGANFKPRSDCLYFEKDQIPSPGNLTEEKLFCMSLQLNDIEDILDEILEILRKDYDDDIG